MGVEAEAVRKRVSGDMARVRNELERLIRIPSISAEGFDPEPVRRSAETSAEILEAAGVPVHIAEVEGGHPAVIGSLPAPEDAPTVLLYATTTCSRPAPRTCGPLRRSARRSDGDACTGEGPATTRREWWRTRRPSGRGTGAPRSA